MKRLPCQRDFLGILCLSSASLETYVILSLVGVV
jgi:hypothetical protein